MSLEEFSSNATVVVTEHQGVGIRSIKVSKGKGHQSPVKKKETVNREDASSYGSYNIGEGISASESLVVRLYQYKVLANYVTQKAKHDEKRLGSNEGNSVNNA